MASLSFISCSPACTRSTFLPQRRSASCLPLQPTEHCRNARTRPRAALPPLPTLAPPVTAALSAASTAAMPFAVWAILLGAATLGLTSQKYRWGLALSPPVVSTLCTLLLSNLSLMPLAHPIYTQVTSVVVPLAVPLILLGADLRRVFSQTGRLLPVFITGAFATCLGTLVAWLVVPIKMIGATSAWKIAAALTARHIGGAVNYVAVVDATNAPPDVVAAALTADNVVVALYFMLLLLLARRVSQPSVPSSADVGGDRAVSIASKSAVTAVETAAEAEQRDAEESDDAFQITHGGSAVALSAAMCTVSAFISSLLPINLGVIPIVTAVAVAVATAFPRQLDPYRRAASAVGVFFMQVFFAVAGAGGSIVSVMRRAPVLLVFSTVQLAVHLGFLLLAAKVFRFHRSEVLVASNANVGGPSTAAAMAGAKSWDRLVVPALLVGVFGYSVATFVSLALGYGVLRIL